jgi:plasmid stability protein
VKNITVSLPEDVYRAARVVAASRDTSVSALVREYLETLEAKTDFERRAQLERDTLASITRFRASGRVKRDAVHERREVR